MILYYHKIQKSQAFTKKIPDDYLSNHETDLYAIVDDDIHEYSPEYSKKVTLINSDNGFTKRDCKRIKWNRV